MPIWFFSPFLFFSPFFFLFYPFVLYKRLMPFGMPVFMLLNKVLSALPFSLFVVYPCTAATMPYPVPPYFHLPYTFVFARTRCFCRPVCGGANLSLFKAFLFLLYFLSYFSICWHFLMAV